MDPPQRLFILTKFICTLGGYKSFGFWKTGFSFLFSEVLNMSRTKRGRGRPVKYVGNVAKHIASLVSKHNAVNARKILRARPKSKLAEKRNTDLIPKPLTKISLPTIYKIAAANKVVLTAGRPKKAA